MNADYWFLLPVGFTIAVLGMSSGISAGNLWVPVYLLWARFDPPVAFWMTLVTMLCGYGSGVVRNLRQGTLNRHFIARYLPITIPAAIAGGYFSPSLNVAWLILLFGFFVLGYGLRLFVLATRRADEASSTSLPSDKTRPFFRSLWEQRGIQDVGRPAVGGGLQGLITVGLGELMLPRMLADRKLYHPAEAVGSAVLMIFVTNLAAALVRLNASFLPALVEQRTALLGAIVFAAPGVIIGGQLGPMIARRLNARTLRLYVSILLVVVGLLMLVRFLATTQFIS